MLFLYYNIVTTKRPLYNDFLLSLGRFYVVTAFHRFLVGSERDDGAESSGFNKNALTFNENRRRIFSVSCVRDRWVLVEGFMCRTFYYLSPTLIFIITLLPTHNVAKTTSYLHLIGFSSFSPLIKIHF